MTRGFTLVELMAALFVFALLSAAGVAVMRRTADAQEASRARLDRIAEFQRARAVLQADLAQIADRRTRDAEGRDAPLAVSGDPAGGPGPLLSFVRLGAASTGARARPSLQYVEYRVVDGRLERRTRPMTDGAPLSPPQVLIDGVRSAASAYYAGGSWAPAWRASTGRVAPEAVRLDLDLDRVGRVSQQFLSAGAPR